MKLLASVSGLSSSDKDAVHRAGETLGITFAPTIDSTSTHLISGTVQSEKYRMAVRLRIPVVHPDWVLRSAQQGSFEPESDFMLQPLYGLTIAVTGTGFDEEVRNRTVELIERLGGTMTRGLTEANTHLIAEAPLGDKFQACCTQLREVQVVSCGWLDACARTGVCAETEPYLMFRREPCLSSCVLHVVDGSATSDELRDLGRAARALGATRIERQSALVTHVLLGEHACDNPLKWNSKAVDASGLAPSATVVAADW